jgi:hypothetical protein
LDPLIKRHLLQASSSTRRRTGRSGCTKSSSTATACTSGSTAVRSLTRAELDWTHKYPAVDEALSSIGACQAQLGARCAACTPTASPRSAGSKPRRMRAGAFGLPVFPVGIWWGRIASSRRGLPEAIGWAGAAGGYRTYDLSLTREWRRRNLQPGSSSCRNRQPNGACLVPAEKLPDRSLLPSRKEVCVPLDQRDG